ncbi:MAG TPA: hypothetical protein VI282_03310 [Verrucomicrobiae bacterium]
MTQLNVLYSRLAVKLDTLPANREKSGMSARFLAFILTVLATTSLAAPLDLKLTQDSVALFEKLEFVLRSPSPQESPEATLEIKSPSGRQIILPAFWFQPFEYKSIDRGGKKSEWMYPTGAAGWRARFAPTEVGAYTATATIRSAGEISHSQKMTFQCERAKSHGFVRVSANNPKLFEFDNGEPFFALGQNLAFIGDNQYLNVDRAAAVFRKMGENGANFARIWVCAEDWAMAIEARKSAWGRGWNWNPPIIPMPGRNGYLRGENCLRINAGESLKVDPSEAVPLRPATAYVLSGKMTTEGDGTLIVELGKGPTGEPIRAKKKGEWQRFTVPFTSAANQWWLGDLNLRASEGGRVLVTDLSLKEAQGGPELLWEADVNRSPRGYYNQPDSFMLDRLLEAAEQNGIYLQLTLLTRDHYMSDLTDPPSADYAAAIRDAKAFMRYAVARWGYSTHVFAWEYFNEMDPNAPTQRFHAELGEYLKGVDPYHHLRTTSGWSPAPAHWKHPDLDIADLHWYLRPNSKPDWRDEISGVLDRAQFLRAAATNKPALLGEFGLADDKWGRSPYMAQDKQNVHFHNALWASALSGLSGAAAFWWWEVLDENDAYAQYKPLARFVRDIPFTSTSLEPFEIHLDESGCRVVGLKGPREAYCWIANDEATWWKVIVEKRSPREIDGASFNLKGLQKGSYHVRWFDTRSGNVIEENDLSADDGINLRAPKFTADIAAKIVLAK